MTDRSVFDSATISAVGKTRSGPGHKSGATGGRGAGGDPYADVSSKTNFGPKISDIGHEDRQHLITYRAEQRGETYTLLNNKSTVDVNQANFHVVRGGGFSLAAPESVPSFQRVGGARVRQRGARLLVAAKVPYSVGGPVVWGYRWVPEENPDPEGTGMTAKLESGIPESSPDGSFDLLEFEWIEPFSSWLGHVLVQGFTPPSDTEEEEEEEEEEEDSDEDPSEDSDGVIDEDGDALPGSDEHDDDYAPEDLARPTSIPGKRIFALGSGSGYAITYSGGFQWRVFTGPWTSAKAVAVGSGRINVLDGSGQKIWTSTDGLSWEETWGASEGETVELLTNPDFEDGDTGWTLTGSAGVFGWPVPAQLPGYSRYVTARGDIPGNFWARQRVQIPERFWDRVDEGLGTVTISVWQRAHSDASAGDPGRVILRAFDENLIQSDVWFSLNPYEGLETWYEPVWTEPRDWFQRDWPDRPLPSTAEMNPPLRYIELELQGDNERGPYANAYFAHASIELTMPPETVVGSYNDICSASDIWVAGGTAGAILESYDGKEFKVRDIEFQVFLPGETVWKTQVFDGQIYAVCASGAYATWYPTAAEWSDVSTCPAASPYFVESGAGLLAFGGDGTIHYAPNRIEAGTIIDGSTTELAWEARTVPEDAPGGRLWGAWMHGHTRLLLNEGRVWTSYDEAVSWTELDVPTTTFLGFKGFLYLQAYGRIFYWKNEGKDYLWSDGLSGFKVAPSLPGVQIVDMIEF